jgi:hypothetical protein
MTLRNPNAGRPGRKPRSVTTNNQKETWKTTLFYLQ